MQRVYVTSTALFRQYFKFIQVLLDKQAAHLTNTLVAPHQSGPTDTGQSQSVTQDPPFTASTLPCSFEIDFLLRSNVLRFFFKKFKLI